MVDAGAGVTVYRGSAYPAEFYGNVFVGDAQNNLVHRRILVPDGPTFRAIRGPREQASEFVRSSDNWFRPVNFVNAPDGTLYVLDMSRAVIEAIHIPLDVVKHLDLKQGRDQGRIYRIAPPRFPFHAAAPLEPGRHRSSCRRALAPDAWYRDTAHRLIYERQDRSAIEPLRKLLHPDASPPTPVTGQCPLVARRSESPARRRYRDCIIGPRTAGSGPGSPACRTAAGCGRRPCLRKSMPLATDADPRVRFQTALALGESDDPRVRLTCSCSIARTRCDRPLDPRRRAQLMRGNCPSA